jgi:hypothetical protein
MPTVPAREQQPPPGPGIVNARVVLDDENLIRNHTIPMEESCPATETHHRKAMLLTSQKCRISSVLAVILVAVGLIVAVVLFTQHRSHAPPAPVPSEREIASHLFMVQLKPLLLQESLTALNNNDSPQSQSLRWLLEKSNFQAWPLQWQVQRYVDATLLRKEISHHQRSHP